MRSTAVCRYSIINDKLAIEQTLVRAVCMHLRQRQDLSVSKCTSKSRCFQWENHCCVECLNEWIKHNWSKMHPKKPSSRDSDHSNRRAWSIYIWWTNNCGCEGCKCVYDNSTSEKPRLKQRLSLSQVKPRHPVWVTRSVNRQTEG